MLDERGCIDILKLVEYQTGHKACIAGGAIRDMVLGRRPKDIDVFLLVYLEQVLHTPESLKLELPPLETLPLPLEYEGRSLLNSYQLGSEMPLQLMVANCLTQEDLLPQFDWNITQFAYTLEGGLYQGIEIKTPGMLVDIPLKLINYDREPIAVLRRGFRFQERYGMAFNKDDFHFLLKACLQQVEGGIH